MGGINPDLNAEEFLRSQKKQMEYVQAHGNPSGRLSVLEAHRIDRLGANLSIPNAAAGDGSDLLLDTDVVDTLADYITYDPASGVYTAVRACRVKIEGWLTWASSATGTRITRLWWKAAAGDPTWYEQFISNPAVVAGTFGVGLGPWPLDLAVGNVFKITVRQNSGGALVLNGSAAHPAAAGINYTSSVNLQLLDVL